jgi:hypothetical protein
LGSRKLTESILDNLQASRIMNKSLKNPKIQVFHEATQQKLAIKKFISTEENLSVNIKQKYYVTIKKVNQKIFL